MTALLGGGLPDEWEGPTGVGALEVGREGAVVVGVGARLRSGRKETMAAVMAAPDAAEKAATRANVVFDMLTKQEGSRGLGVRGTSGVLRDVVARSGSETRTDDWATRLTG